MNITNKASTVLDLMIILIAVIGFGNNVSSQESAEGVKVRPRRPIWPVKIKTPEIRPSL
jgi:hypothetical protein